MAKRENAFVEVMKFLKEMNSEAKEKYNKKIQNENARTDDFYRNYYSIIESRERNATERANLMENALNLNLSTAIKGIYITALESETLTDEAIMLAEGLVDNWIKDNGGATKIMRENKNKTYLLDTLFSIVEKASIEDINSILESEDDKDITKTDGEKEESDNSEDKNEKDTKEEDNSEDKKEEDIPEDDTLNLVDNDTEDDESKEDNSENNEESPEEDDTLDLVDDNDESEEDTDDMEEVIDDIDDSDITTDNTDSVEEESPEEDDTFDLTEDDEPNVETEDEEDKDLDGIEDDIEDDIETEVPEDSEEVGDVDVLRDLDKEEDVQKAVATIRQRVADAEETFIKNNAKDKEQINDLLAKISDNIKTVEDMSDKDKEAGKDKVAEESTMLLKRKINEITNNRPINIFENFCRTINREILNESIDNTAYLDETGKIDMESVVESTRIMYGFLETLNTIQLQKIDKKYLESII